MSGLTIGVIGFLVMLALLVVRMPIGVSMALVGLGGLVVTVGTPDAMLNLLKTDMWRRFSSFDLAVIPLFVLMGQFAAKAGLSQALFRAAYVWLGHLRGGIAMAAIGACAGFGAISGSSLATAATMGQVALPELRRYHYAGSLATGTLAAGGTLGILIPPSVPLIIYAILVEGSIARLFQAALVPGIIATVGYMLAIAVYVRLYPDSGPAGLRVSYAERFKALWEIWPVLFIFVLVIGGIYGGIFTPNEGASVGATGMLIIAVVVGGMRWRGFVDALIGTAGTTGIIFLILFGAGIFNSFLAFTQLPLQAAEVIRDSGLSPLMLILILILIYLALGCVMDSLSMILLTMPIFWPIVSAMDYGMPTDDVRNWFGIVTLMVVEMGLITPPVGLNVYIINSMARDVPMAETFQGIIPYLVADCVRVGLIVFFPILTLYLPHAMR